MPSFGERLKYEREARNRTIEEIGAATGIRLGYLEALEKNEFHTLPGRAFGKLYIRAYAQILGFDPQPLIDQYDREQHQQRRAATEPPSPEPDRSRRVEGMIANWREAKMAGRNKPERAELFLEVQRERSAETPWEQLQEDSPDEVHEGELSEDSPTQRVGAERETAKATEIEPGETAEMDIGEIPEDMRPCVRASETQDALEDVLFEASPRQNSEPRQDGSAEAPSLRPADVSRDGTAEAPAAQPVEAGVEAPPHEWVEVRPDDRVDARPDDEVDEPPDDGVDAPPDDGVEEPTDDRVDARPETTSSVATPTSSTSGSTTPDNTIDVRQDDRADARPETTSSGATPTSSTAGSTTPDIPIELRQDDRVDARPDDRVEAPSTRSAHDCGGNDDPEDVLLEAHPGQNSEREAPGEHDRTTLVVPFTRANRRASSTVSSSRWPMAASLLIGGLLLVAAGAYFAFFRMGSRVNVLSSAASSAQGVPDQDRTSLESRRDSPAHTLHPPATHAPRPPAIRAAPRPAPGPVGPATAHTSEPAAAHAAEPATAHASEPAAARRSGKAPLVAVAQTGRLTVPEFGLGRRIVNRRLEDRDERFSVGEVVLFSTRVLGGRSGEHVRHVWLREGRGVQSIVLQLHGSDWRTYSRKTLRDTGQWTVEARDEQGRVLASATLTVVPAGPSTH